MRTAGRVGALTLGLAAVTAACLGAGDRTALVRLSDDEFRRLSIDLSGPGGDFHANNLVSNELSSALSLRRLSREGGAYIGVGPEQNFSYIAQLGAEIAFIIDIREANRTLHLLYKALFDVSADRREFVSRLFSREPPDLDHDVSVRDLFGAYTTARPSADLLDSTTRLVVERLVPIWPLTEADRAEITSVLQAFFEDGPDIHYDRSRPASDQRPSYRALMTATDQMGTSRSYLASEDRFQFVKELHARNLIVPVVGDFGAGVVISRVSDAVRRRGLSVTAFYASNVEVYLTNQQMVAFCGSLWAMPAATSSVFIDAKELVPLTAKLAVCPPDRRPFEGWRRTPNKSP